jgi:hypothetical protein
MMGLAGLLALLCATTPAFGQALEPDSLLAHVRYLASDALRGREAGERGADSAAAYIARAMEAYELTPLGEDGYLQPFDITLTVAIGPDSRLVLRAAGDERELKLYEEWLPFLFSGSGSLSGHVARAGYGLTDEAYESLAGGDGQLVIALESGVPEGYNPHAGGGATPRFKATAARQHGADAVLITVPRIEVPQPGEPPHSVGIPAAQILDDDSIRAWLEREDLEVTLDARVEPVEATAYNVVGRLDGSDPQLADEVIVVGAHYDHLGMGGPGSLAPDVEAVHNGADDNASGTALLLGLARYYSEHPERRPGRSLVFIAFSAEEMGLIGSEYFVDHPPVPLERVAAMINFDMVGRLKEGKVQVFGTETAKEFTALLDSLDAASELTLSRVGDGYGPSDQTSFYSHKIPVLHFFTGTHSEYHRPEDDWQLINAAGMAQVGELAMEVLDALGDRPQHLTLVEQERPTGGGGGYGPYLGTVPDFGEVEGGGLRLSAVRAGSPAEAAGLQAGDVVIRFGEREVTNIYDYTFALREHSPGDTVAIKVRRGDQTVELAAVLARRQ